MLYRYVAVLSYHAEQLHGPPVRDDHVCFCLWQGADEEEQAAAAAAEVKSARARPLSITSQRDRQPSGTGNAAFQDSSKPASGLANGTAAAPDGYIPGHQCDFCHMAPEKLELLLRCSRCKQAWYCNQTCQRSAWPQHKQECKRLQSSSGPSSCSSSAATSPTALQSSFNRSSIGGRAEPSDTSAAVDTNSRQASSPDRHGSTAAAAAAEKRAAENANMMDVLKNYLQQHSANQSDPLQQQFEQAVLLYVRQEHRTALAQLQAVQRAAEQQGQLALAGDACKWMGHAYAKLGDASKAAASFANGCQLAEKSGNKKLQVGWVEVEQCRNVVLPHCSHAVLWGVRSLIHA